MNRLLRTVLVVLSFVCLPGLAQAQPTVQQRCSVDTRNLAQARARAEWSRRCALTVNTNGPSSWFNSTRAFDQSSQPAKEYRELNVNRAYTSNLNEYDINYTTQSLLYSSSPVVTVFQETSGPTAGYYNWSGTPRSRPLYPVYETAPSAGAGIQLFPNSTLSDCQLYTAQNGTGLWTGNFYVVGYCYADERMLSNGVPLTSQSGAIGNEKTYSLQVPAGTRQVVFDISGGTGDADLYVQGGTYPTLTSYTCRPFLDGNNEQCVINSPAAGTWYVILRGWSDYAGVTLTGRLVP